MNNVAVVSMEVLVTGVTASIWIILLVLRLMYPEQIILQKLMEIVNSISMGNLLVVSITMYNIGWVVHHLSELTLDFFGQRRYRNKLYADEKFYSMRAVIFQYGSQSTMDDIRFARHVIRISRSNILNFGLLTLVFLYYIPINKRFFLIAAIGSLIVTILSVLQWVSRYKATYQMFLQIYDAIVDQKKAKTEEQKVTKCKRTK